MYNMLIAGYARAAASRSAARARARLYSNKHYRRYKSSSPPLPSLSPDEIRTLLATPTWSVASVTGESDPPAAAPAPAAAAITPKQLHHLLRLSALPPPASPQEEASMIATLEEQLRFVQAIQNEDTDGVEPLVAIRDESEEAEREQTLDLASMRDELDQEEAVGWAKRIQRKKKKKGTEKEAEGKKDKDDEGRKNGDGDEDAFDILKLAPKTRGRYVVVEANRP